MERFILRGHASPRIFFESSSGNFSTGVWRFDEKVNFSTFSNFQAPLLVEAHVGGKRIYQKMGREHSLEGFFLKNKTVLVSITAP